MTGRRERMGRVKGVSSSDGENDKGREREAVRERRREGRERRRE